ncbi:LOW QUALITY PROTEIN: Zinc finger protein Xfin [Vespula squamosa]|uniref:Zinc finger protein Xfin n=1 Tax=Vespula squamosa TaxID=30214 RepID=A0ABD2A2T5_VESSQ
MDHQSSNESSFEETLSFKEFTIEDTCIEDICAVPLQYEENNVLITSNAKPTSLICVQNGFACTYSMKRHQRTVCGKIRNTNGQFKCKCGRSYPNKGNLKRHVVNECGVERRFWCCFCLKRFTQNSSRIRHLRKFHKDQYEKFISVKAGLYCDLLPADVWKECKDHLLCLKCSKRYSDWRRAASMQKMEDSFGTSEHSGRSTFVCPKCGKGYTRKASLQRHLSTGCGTWNIRGYWKSNKDDVNLPKCVPDLIESNTDQDNTEKTNTVYKCNVNKHICNFCEKVFPLRGLLKRHIQVGCKMNPRNSHFVCGFCQYTSMYKANMERHVRNVHDTGNSKFRCDLCNFSSNYSFCVRRHMNTFHPSSSWPIKNVYGYNEIYLVNDHQYYDDEHQFDQQPSQQQDQEQQQQQQQYGDKRNDLQKKMFTCPDCKKCYVVSRSLWRHRKFECINAKPKLACDSCPYQSPHKWCIENHKKKHHSNFMQDDPFNWNHFNETNNKI